METRKWKFEETRVFDEAITNPATGTRSTQKKRKDFTKEVLEATYEDFRGQLNNPELMEKVLNY